MGIGGSGEEVQAACSVDLTRVGGEGGGSGEGVQAACCAGLGRAGGGRWTRTPGRRRQGGRVYSIVGPGERVAVMGQGLGLRLVAGKERTALRVQHVGCVRGLCADRALAIVRAGNMQCVDSTVTLCSGNNFTDGCSINMPDVSAHGGVGGYMVNMPDVSAHEGVGGYMVNICRM